MLSPTKSPRRWLDLLKEDSPDWGEILTRLDREEARAWDTGTGLTALHYAVMRATSRTTISATKSDDAKTPFQIIKRLIRLYPEAARKTCFQYGYTPLSYACHLSDSHRDLVKEQAQIVRLLLTRAPEALTILSKEGHDPLSVHIMSATRLAGTISVKPSSRVLKALTASASVIHLERGLERLYACNTLEILQSCADEEARTRLNKHKGSGRSAATPGSTLNDFWIWRWVLLILKAIHHAKTVNNQEDPSNTTTPPFRPLHVAAQITDCPVPFLILAMRAYPSEVLLPDPRSTNLPLHSVAGWQLFEEYVAGESSLSSTCRKSMCLTSLVVEYPKSIQAKNGDGLTAKQVEEQSGSIIPSA